MNSILYRVYNPKGRTCGCSPECWCQRSRIGRMFRWWFPGRYFGIHHKFVSPEWKRAHERGA